MARSAQRKLRRDVGRTANAHVHDRPLTKRRAVLRPAGEDAVDVGADAIAGNVAGHAGHQQGVVVGVLVADRTAESTLAFLARRVSAASPAPRKTW